MGLAAGVVLGLPGYGCQALRYTNSAPVIEHHIRATSDSAFVSQFKAAVLYPARDILTLDPLWRRLLGDEAWNATDGGVADSSFFTRREVAELIPEQVAQDPDSQAAPVQPFTIDWVKSGGAAPGFLGTDAEGRKYLVETLLARQARILGIDD